MGTTTLLLDCWMGNEVDIRYWTLNIPQGEIMIDSKGASFHPETSTHQHTFQSSIPLESRFKTPAAIACRL